MYGLVNMKIDKESIFILGVPFGFTPLIYDGVVNCLGYEEYIDDRVAKGEYLNVKNIKESVCKDHCTVKKSDGVYWCLYRGRAKENTIENIYSYSLEPTIIRDTTEPEIMHSFVSRNNPKTFVVDFDVPYIAMNCSKRKVYFPTNILDLENEDKNLIESLDYTREMFLELDNYDNTTVIEMDKVFENPENLYDYFEDNGFDVEKNKSVENSIKRASESYEKGIKDKKYKEMKKIYEECF